MEEATQLQSYINKGIEYAIGILPNLAMGILALIIGFWLIKKVVKILNVSLKKAGLEHEIVSFLSSIANILLKIFLLLSIAGLLGFDTAALIGVLAAASFAVGMALQGSLSNFAAGIIIVLFKPYKVGDWVEVQEKFGKVEDIQIFNTLVTTPGKKVLIIPNGEVISGIVTNFSKKGNIRMELSVTMPYAESFPRVKEIILKELESHTKILNDPKPEIGIENFDSHSVVLAVRPYVMPDDYWEVYYDTYAMIKSAFNKNGIKVAYSEGVEIGEIGG